LKASLLDVNVLIALFDADHIHHDLAHDWFADEGSKAWATCSVTENGFLRVLSNPAYHRADLRLATLVPLLRRFCAHKGHHAWNDSVSLRNRELFDVALIKGHRQLTDVYLMGLAHHMGGRLATFDQTIPVKAVVGAGPDVLQIIEP
jgi:toxin-antitoxin system PIN domain toxin